MVKEELIFLTDISRSPNLVVGRNQKEKTGETLLADLEGSGLGTEGFSPKTPTVPFLILCPIMPQ